MQPLYVLLRTGPQRRLPMDRVRLLTEDGDRRSLGQGLFCGQIGHSAVEYAVLLGLLISTVGGGVVWLGISSRQSLMSLTGQMTGPLPATSSNGYGRGNAVSSRADDSPNEPMPFNRDRSSPVLCLSLALGSGAIGLGWVWLVRRRARGVQLVPHDGNEAPDLQERFCTKRQHLLRLFAQDPTILLKNQLAVRHLMTTDIITVTSSTTRQLIREKMLEANVRHLPVCGPGQQLLGIVSDRDLSSKPGKTAGELMSAQLKTISP